MKPQFSLFTFVVFSLLIQNVISQNLPSLLLNRNINSTFSILAYDKENQEWGIAVATNNIYVGNSTIYITPGLGAFSVIAETEPAYAINGFEQLKKGKSIEQAILFTKNIDTGNYYRQVSGIDNQGKVFAFTGDALKYWKGYSNHILGKGFVVMGNQLADSVLFKMADTYENTKGSLAERLLKSITAGQNAGGQITGKQSAALVIKGVRNEWFNQIDLRVDNSKTPFVDLQNLLNYHYDRILLNQSLSAIRMKDNQRGENLLVKAVKLVDGWNGIYSKIAEAYLLLGNEPKAVSIIQRAISENPLWIENISVFYCLVHQPAIHELINVHTFTIKDWNNAILFMININQNSQAIELALNVLSEYPSSSYTYYLAGKAYSLSGNRQKALVLLKKAIILDTKNHEAKVLYQKLI